MPRRGVNLTEEQWRDIKTRAAARGMTISEYIGQLASVKPSSSELLQSYVDKPQLTDPARDREIKEVKLHEVSLVPDTPENRAAGTQPIRQITPAPKPTRKKK